MVAATPIQKPSGRIGWILETLAISPTERILELGCGGGTVLWHVASRLTPPGIVSGVDRSTTMIKLAAGRNSEHLAAGRATLHHVRISELALPKPAFHKIFAINVGIFWSQTAQPEWDAVREHLGTGTLHLFYRSAEAERTAKIAARAASALHAQGFTSATVFTPSGRLCCVRASTAPIR